MSKLSFWFLYKPTRKTELNASLVQRIRSKSCVGFPNGLSGRPADQKGYKPRLKSKSREELHCMTQIWKYVKLQQYHPNDHRQPISDRLPTTFQPSPTSLQPRKATVTGRPKTCQVRRLGLHLRKSGIELHNKKFWKSNKIMSICLEATPPSSLRLPVHPRALVGNQEPASFSYWF